MKKIFLLFVAVCALIACDPVQEKISNDGDITLEQLKAMTTVTVDQAPSGKNGNVITCQTSAPVNAVWNVSGKQFIGNYAYKKMKVGKHTVVLTALCANGTKLTTEWEIVCDEITNPLVRTWIYGKDPEKEPPFSPGGWDAAQMRFSDTEGKHFPFLSDDIYWGLKTLTFDITDATDDCKVAIMNGWWTAWFNGNGSRVADRVDVPVKNGQFELPLTEDIAKDCAKGKGGAAHDLQLMITSGSCTFNNCYYEE